MRVILALIAVTLCATPAMAADALKDPGQRFLEQEKQRKLEEELLREQDKINAPEVKKPAQAGEDAMCFPIKTITLEGATLLSAKEIAQLIKPYEGTCMGYNAIGALIQDITNLYIDKGYVTSRAMIPSQNLKEGSLKLLVQEGKVENIELNSNGLREKLRLSTAFPGLKGGLLNLRDLEQGIDQMNRLSSSRAELKLWPGKDVGGTKVVITDKVQDTARGTVSYDNYGQSSTGINRLRVGLEKDNLLSLNDSLSFNYIGSRDTNALAFSGSVPYGYWTFSLDSSYSEYFSVLDEAAEMFGTSWNNTITANRVIHRGKNSQTALLGALNLKESSRLLNDIYLTPQPMTVARFGATHTQRTDRSVWYFDGTYSRGLSMLGATRDMPGLSADSPRAQFDKLDGGVTYLRPFSLGRVNASLRGQYAFDSLYGSEQINMGDSSTVRGFSGAGIAGDSGLYSRNEFSFTMPSIIQEKMPVIAETVQPYVFADAGYTKLKAVSQYDAIAGTGAGLRFNWKRLRGDLAFAVPVYTGTDMDTGFEVYFNVSMQLF